MFEHYMIQQAPDRRRRHRIVAAIVAATLGSALVLATTWMTERLALARVEAPGVGRLEIMGVQLLATPELIKPPPLPSTPPVDRAASEPSIFERVEAVESPRAGERARASARDGAGESVFGRLADRGCPLGAVCGPASPRGGDGDGDGDGGPGGGESGRGGGGEARSVDFEQLRCRACADPAAEALRKTPAAAMQRSGANETRFCVDESGRTYGVRTERSIGDAAVDRICRQTVEGWRFSPLQVAGRARRACSSVRFDIRFDR